MNPAKLQYIKSWLYRANEDIAVKIKITVESFLTEIK